MACPRPRWPCKNRSHTHYHARLTHLRLNDILHLRNYRNEGVASSCSHQCYYQSSPHAALGTWGATKLPLCAMDTSGQSIRTALTRSRSLQTTLRLSVMDGHLTIKSLPSALSIVIMPKLPPGGI